MSNEEAIKIILEIMSVKHSDTMTNRRIYDALSKAVEALQDKVRTEEIQSNW